MLDFWTLFARSNSAALRYERLHRAFSVFQGAKFCHHYSVQAAGPRKRGPRLAVTHRFNEAWRSEGWPALAVSTFHPDLVESARLYFSQVRKLPLKSQFGMLIPEGYGGLRLASCVLAAARVRPTRLALLS